MHAQKHFALNTCTLMLDSIWGERKPSVYSPMMTPTRLLLLLLIFRFPSKGIRAANSTPTTQGLLSTHQPCKAKRLAAVTQLAP